QAFSPYPHSISPAQAIGLGWFFVGRWRSNPLRKHPAFASGLQHAATPAIPLLEKENNKPCGEKQENQGRNDQEAHPLVALVKDGIRDQGALQFAEVKRGQDASGGEQIHFRKFLVKEKAVCLLQFLDRLGLCDGSIREEEAEPFFSAFRKFHGSRNAGV
ncbi:MAG: hypothetical protein WCH57_10510, partial [Verrucomicrobiota bacterium]